MRTKSVAVLLVLAGAVGVGAAWLMQRIAAGGVSLATPQAPAESAVAPGTPMVPLQVWQQELLQQARSGQAPSMRKLAQSLAGDTVSYIDANTALYWAQQAQAAGDPAAAALVAEVQAYLRQAKAPDRSAAEPSLARQAHDWLLSYATSYEACSGDKRGACFDQNRKVLAESGQLQQAWREVLGWPAAAAPGEALDAKRAAAYLLSFGLQPFGLPQQRTPWRGADDPLKGRAQLEELAASGELQDKLMLALALHDSPAAADQERARKLVGEIESSTDARKLSAFRYSLLEQPAQRGWVRRAHDRLFPNLGDPTAHYLRRAADAGAFNEAQTLGLAYFFGGAYFAGLSVEQWDIANIKLDHAAALKYLERAEISGRRESAAVLGALLLAGSGVAQDYNRGLRLMRDAAGSGSLWAMGSLAQIYARGSFGTEKSPTAGYAMANIAMRLSANKAASDQFAANLDEAGIEMAKTALNDLQDQLAGPQLARAQEISRDWMPGTVLPTSASGRGLLHGTGVYISARGEMLTNAHVVKGCQKVRLTDTGEEGSVARVDTANDLALIRFQRGGAAYVPVRLDPPNLGEPITVFGFPLVGPLSAAGNVTNGIVSSESGYEDNSLQFQFTAPVQSGSSGGPVLDSKARLVGVITGKLNAELTARTTGETPQNANFGIKNVAVAAFLRGASVDYAKPGFYAGLMDRSPENLAQDARAASRRIECAP
jgi:S1-C subfamily serine protease